MVRVYEAPWKGKLPGSVNFSIFLAGSIENGEAENWQKELIQKLALKFGDNVAILNPRRADWDPKLEPVESNPVFRSQVKWERKWINYARLKVFVFLAGTNSIVSMLELGEYGDEYDTVVFCQKEYCRKGNIDIFCEEKDIPMVDSWKELIEFITDAINNDA